MFHQGFSIVGGLKMQNEILVTVVITTYKRTNTLKRAITSVLNQSHEKIEIIVVDDNNDLSIRNEVEEIVNSFRNLRIRLIKNSRNLGGSLSRNEGIKEAKAEYICFLDDDDEYYPNKVEKQLELFLDSDDNLGMVYCYCKEIMGNGRIKIYRNDHIGNCVYQGMYDCMAATSQFMCRKKALMDIGMFSDVPCKQDSNLILKLLINGYSVNRVAEVLSIYHSDGTNRISTAGHKKRIEGEENLLAVCRNNYHLIDNYLINKVEYSFACRLFEHYYAVGDTKRFYACFRKVMKFPSNRKTLSALKHVLKLFFDGDKNENVNK